MKWLKKNSCRSSGMNELDSLFKFRTTVRFSRGRFATSGFVDHRPLVHRSPDVHPPVGIVALPWRRRSGEKDSAETNPPPKSRRLRTLYRLSHGAAASRRFKIWSLTAYSEEEWRTNNLNFAASFGLISKVLGQK